MLNKYLRYKIMAVGVDDTQLRLLSRELSRWKMQHTDNDSS